MTKFYKNFILKYSVALLFYISKKNNINLLKKIESI